MEVTRLPAPLTEMVYNGGSPGIPPQAASTQRAANGTTANQIRTPNRTIFSLKDALAVQAQTIIEGSPTPMVPRWGRLVKFASRLCVELLSRYNRVYGRS
jgi:hypothetical protein